MVEKFDTLPDQLRFDLKKAYVDGTNEWTAIKRLNMERDRKIRRITTLFHKQISELQRACSARFNFNASSLFILSFSRH